MFKVGQKVVCVDNSDMKSGNVKKSGLVLHEIYTIKLLTSPFVGCFLKEVPGEFSLSRFRPLDETFAESVLENIKEQIKEEELICV